MTEPEPESKTRSMYRYVILYYWTQSWGESQYRQLQRSEQ